MENIDLENEERKIGLDTFVKFSPVILVVMGFFLGYKIFMTPSDVHQEMDKLEAKIEKTYATKEETKGLQRQYDNITVKIDKIYDYIITRR